MTSKVRKRTTSGLFIGKVSDSFSFLTHVGPNSSMRKENQSKNQIQEIKENTIKNNLLHFLK